MPSAAPTPVIVCLSHLGWDHVWQRPQQVLSRLSRRFPVLYINEPELDDAAAGRPAARLVTQDGPLRAWQPVFASSSAERRRWRADYVELVTDLLVRHGLAARRGAQLVPACPLVLWFYTPAPYYMLDHVPASLVVLDVMDDLASFDGAAPDLAWRERQVMARAGLVFAGGRTLYEARRGRHPQVHLFPSGVEPEHFTRALRPETPIDPSIAGLPRPILGYYGVVDERIDLALLDALATTHPEWSLVIVGPTAKIEPARLPRAANLHYLGKQPYAALPGLLKGFDVCLMPFALNRATRSISPTKALEYMAARRPIVSTAVPDVVANWSDAIAVADAPAGFIAAVGAALREPAEERQAREQRQQAHVTAATWDRLVTDMGDLIDRALGGHAARRSA